MSHNLSYEAFVIRVIQRYTFLSTLNFNSMRHFIYLLLVLALAFCSTQERTPSEYVTAGSDLSSTTPNAVLHRPLNDGSPLYKQSEEFDRWLQGNLPAQSAQHLKDECRHHHSNPFCPSFLKGKTLFEIREARSRIYTPVEIRPILPVKPDIHEGKIKNWRDLRNAEIPQLLKGLLASSSAELTLLKNAALKETRCPNNAAIALAASLEDFLPNDANPGDIAALYFHGARCTKRQPVDREHFLTRAALFHIALGQHKKAAEILVKVKPTDAFSGRASYWLYRSYLALGEKEKAHRTHQFLTRMHPFSFHALLAWRDNSLDAGDGILGEKEFFEKRSKRSKVANQFLYQVEVLKKYGFDYSASLLVDYILDIQRLEPPLRAYAASMGDPKTKIGTASEFFLRRSSHLCRSLLELGYPKAFFPLFMKYGNSAISPYLAMSIARRESGFDPRAVSPANAQGLLQINPDTGIKLTGGKVVDLLDPAINIDLGTRYLADLVHKEFSSVYLAVAAYNAGEQSVGVWLKRYPKTNPILFIDLIPYRETRDYVANVLTNYFWYRRIYEGFQPTLDLVP